MKLAVTAKTVAAQAKNGNYSSQSCKRFAGSMFQPSRRDRPEGLAARNDPWPVDDTRQSGMPANYFDLKNSGSG
jgi:hypothetical protein